MQPPTEANSASLISMSVSELGNGRQRMESSPGPKHQEAPSSVKDAVAKNKSSDSKGSEVQNTHGHSSIRHLLRVFTYNDSKAWVLNIIAFFCMIVSGTVLPLMDVVFGMFINVFNDFVRGDLSAAGYRSEVNRFSLYFIYLFLGKFILTYIWTVFINITAIRTTKELRIAFVRQTLRQEISFFDAPTTSVSGQVTTNGNLINNGISEKLGLTVQALASFVTAFVVAFVVQWKLTLIVVSIVPVNIVVTIVCVIYDTACEYEMFNIYSKAGSLAEEAFSTIRTAHAFWAFPKLSKRFNKTLDDAAKVGARKSLIYAILFPVEFFCIFSGYGLAFWQGMRMYSEGEIEDPGTVVTVIFAVLVAAQALTQIAPQTIAISKATAAAADMFAIIDRKSKVDSLSLDGVRINEFNGNIEFRDVRFAYPSRPNVPVLHGLNLQVPAGKTTALVGTSGSGKSTLFGLLERWYLHSHGSITLDGHSIDNLNLQWLRTNIRLVQQEPTLFSGTIYQNVVDGLTGSTMASLPEDEKRYLVEESCKSAFAHEFIQDMPQGYDTVIGERGASLSGGQKQRIVIARSIISNPKVLLLDEATSALDPKAEKIVQQALNNVSKGRTMVVIAHRLSTIRDADNIIVMKQGQTIEQGSHNELVELGATYARLVQAQDLGQGKETKDESECEGDEEGTAENLDRPLTTVSVTPSGGVTAAIAAAQKEDEGYGLFEGVYYIIKEQTPLWTSLFITILCTIAGGATYPALAILFSRTMEAFETIDVSRANFYALMFFIVAIGNFIAYAIAGWLANVIAQHIIKVYRAEIFDNTLRQDMSFFDSPSHGTGALVARLSAEPTSLQELLSMNFALILINLVNLMSSSILAIAFGWKLGLVLVFGALPVLVGSGYLRIRLEFKFEQDTTARFASSSALASEAVMAIRTVSSLALEGAIVDRYRKSLEGIAQHAIGNLGWKMLFYSLSQSIAFLAMGLGFWYGGRLVSTSEYTTGQFYTIFVAVIFSGESAASLFQYTTSITKARTAINYIFKLRRTQTLHDKASSDGDGNSGGDTTEKARTVLEKGPAIQCEDVGFCYPLRPKLTVLKRIDINISPGKMVAFVGASGCGKSTMISLLQRFYDPTNGHIIFDGQDIKTLDRRHYRHDIALVQQEPVLYQGSIRENIALGLEDDEPTDAEIEDVCRQANVWGFVSSLPEGLGTLCGNQGLSFSGGQRQRIAIARALVRKPRLLLLDEATSALDTESEKIVKEALDRAAEGCTMVAVAHRLSTIRDADLIVVFERGRVAQQGTHQELIAKGGIYYEMVMGQSLDREA